MIWRCSECATIIGDINGAAVTIRHEGREVHCQLPVIQQCHRCRAINTMSVPTDGYRQPWDREPGEPALWYSRFTRYRLLGPGRSIERAFRSVMGCTTKQRANPGWYRNAQRWRWAERAEAWDSAEQQRADAIVEHARLTLQKSALRAATVLVRHLTVERIGLRAAKEILDRAGVPPLMRIAPTTPDGQNEYAVYSDSQLVAELNRLFEAARARAAAASCDSDALSLATAGEGQSTAT